MKQIIKLGFILAAYASVACVSLALVYNITAPAIEKTKQAKASAGMKTVFADADAFEKTEDFQITGESPVIIQALYTAKKSGSVIGAVVQAEGPTYDKAVMLVGLDLKRTITGIQFLSLTDTPGFGQRAAEPAFYEQFTGLSAVKTLEAGKDFDGLSGATISTKGITDIVNHAAWTAGEYLAANYGGQSGSGAPPPVEKPATVFDFDSACAELFPQETYTAGISYTEDAHYAGTLIRGIRIDKLWTVFSDGKPVGAMAAATGASYHGTASVLTAVDMNRTLLGARITALNDTPKIGQRALEKVFYEQFTGKSADEEMLAGSGLDALSGATITSACIADIVKVSASEAAVKAAEQGGQKAPENSDAYRLNEMQLEE